MNELCSKPEISCHHYHSHNAVPDGLVQYIGSRGTHGALRSTTGMSTSVVLIILSVLTKS